MKETVKDNTKKTENEAANNTTESQGNSGTNNKSVASQLLSVKETRSTELSADEEEYWEKMTKERLKKEAVARRKDIGLVVMFIIMCILCAFLVYIYDQQLWIFSNPYK